MSEADEDLSDDEQEEPMDTTPASTVAQLTIFDQQTGPTKEVRLFELFFTDNIIHQIVAKINYQSTFIWLS